MMSFLEVVAGRKRNLVKAYTPDEVLWEKTRKVKEFPGEIPFEHVDEMPCDELMIAIQAVAAEYPELRGKLDFTCLVALAMMCEEEMNELIGENGHLMYAQGPSASSERGSSEQVSSVQVPDR